MLPLDDDLTVFILSESSTSQYTDFNSVRYDIEINYYYLFCNHLRVVSLFEDHKLPSLIIRVHI